MTTTTRITYTRKEVGVHAYYCDACGAKPARLYGYDGTYSLFCSKKCWKAKSQ